MAEITQLEIERKEQYVIFNDSDSQTDYFHSTRGSLKYIISTIKKYGGKQIIVNVINNAQDIPAVRRINAICKQCGYTAKDVSEMRTCNKGDTDEFTVKHLEWILTK